MIALAYDLVEERMLKGTATSQEVTHFLKLGSSREKLEKERLKEENKLLAAKVEQIASQGRMEELYQGAIEAMSTYKGNVVEEEEPPYDDQDLFRTQGPSDVRRKV